MKNLGEVRIALWTGSWGNHAAIEACLAHLGCHVTRVEDHDTLWKLVEKELDLVVVHCQGAEEVLSWMKGVKLAGTQPPPVLTVATALDVEKYLQAMSLGAFDCVALPIEQRELQRVVWRALEERRAEPLLLHA